MPDIKDVVQQIARDEEGVVVPILQRTAKPYLAADGTKATVTVIGSESKRYRKMRDELLRKAAESGSEADEDKATVRIAIAAGAVTAWHGWGANGTEPPCTPENVQVLLSVEHILAQVEQGIGRRADFFADASAG